MHMQSKQEGNDPLEAVVMISDRKLGLKSLNYPVIYCHVALALSQLLSKRKITAVSKQIAEITKM